MSGYLQAALLLSIVSGIVLSLASKHRFERELRWMISIMIISALCLPPLRTLVALPERLPDFLEFAKGEDGDAWEEKGAQLQISLTVSNLEREIKSLLLQKYKIKEADQSIEIETARGEDTVMLQRVTVTLLRAEDGYLAKAVSDFLEQTLAAEVQVITKEETLWS